MSDPEQTQEDAAKQAEVAEIQEAKTKGYLMGKRLSRTRRPKPQSPYPPGDARSAWESAYSEGRRGW